MNEMERLRRVVKAMRDNARVRLRADAWRWPHVPAAMLNSVIDALGEITVVEAREVLARIEAERGAEGDNGPTDQPGDVRGGQR